MNFHEEPTKSHSFCALASHTVLSCPVIAQFQLLALFSCTGQTARLLPSPQASLKRPEH
jgi:hypothetical protein